MPSADVQGWLDKAKEDEAVVETLKRAGGPWPATTYPAQQAAEKYVKAAVVSSGEVPRRTHDIEDLLEILGTAVDVKVQSAAASISIFAIMSRYPGGPVIGEAQVNQALSDLAALKKWALNVIG